MKKAAFLTTVVLVSVSLIAWTVVAEREIAGPSNEEMGTFHPENDGTQVIEVAAPRSTSLKSYCTAFCRSDADCNAGCSCSAYGTCG